MTNFTSVKDVVLAILAVLSCLGLLVGAIVAAILAMAAESRGRPRYINCPNCLDSVLVDAETCPHCGHKMK